MATYLSNELAGTTDGKTTVAAASWRTKGSVINGRVKRFRATITLNGQVSGDAFQLFTLPSGASFILGDVVNSVSLGSATLGVGSLSNPTKYRGQSAGMTNVDTPVLFASASAGASELATEEAVYASLGGASLPGSGTLVIDMLVSLTT